MNVDLTETEWVQIMGLGRTGGSLLARRFDSYPVDTGIFSFPYEFALSETYGLKEDYYNFTTLPRFYQNRILKGGSGGGLTKLKTVSKDQRFTQIEVERFVRTLREVDWQFNGSLMQLATIIGKFCWNISGEVNITHVINHFGGSIKGDQRYFLNELHNTKIVITLRNPLDILVSTLTKAKKSNLRLDNVFRITLLEYYLFFIKIKIIVQQYSRRIFFIHLEDIVLMNENFHNLLDFIGIREDLPIDFTATTLGKPWKGNSTTGRIETPKLIHHKNIYPEYIHDEDMVHLEGIYQDFDNNRKSGFASETDFSKEIHGINRILGKDYLCYKELNQYLLDYEKILWLESYIVWLNENRWALLTRNKIRGRGHLAKVHNIIRTAEMIIKLDHASLHKHLLHMLGIDAR